MKFPKLSEESRSDLNKSKLAKKVHWLLLE